MLVFEEVFHLEQTPRTGILGPKLTKTLTAAIMNSANSTPKGPVGSAIGLAVTAPAPVQERLEGYHAHPG
jgi:hypothetical protein